MNMEGTTGPRIYVPINMLDHASQPTYAVLEFVGFSSPAPSPGPHRLLGPAHTASPCPSAPPAMLCLPPASSSSLSTPVTATAPGLGPTASFYPLPAAVPSCHTIVQPPPLLPISHFPADSNAFLLPSPSHLLPPNSHHHQQYHYVPARSYVPAALLEAATTADSRPSSPPSLAPSSASSASRESSKEKFSQSSSPAMAPQVPLMGSKPVVCFAPSISDSSSALVNGANARPAANFTSSAAEGAHPCGLSISRGSFSQINERDAVQTKISVSQTDRETVVHTHSSNFRDVVRQLTGASSDDQDLLPVTLPARLANRVNNINMVQTQINSGTEVVTAGASGSLMGANGSGLSGREQLGLRRAPMKLHERRKSTMKNLEKVTSGASLHGAVEVSPIMNPSPVTPLASDFERCCNASTPTSQGSSGLNSPIMLLGTGKGAMEAAVGRAVEQNQQQENGCFFSLQRPPAGPWRPSSPLENQAPPTLLSLFPESPACSPHAR